MISLWRAFKKLKSERGVDNADETDFQEENSKFYSGTSKGLSPFTTPFGKRRFYQGSRFITDTKRILCQCQIELVKSIF
jgi:hypothetical protein